MSSDDEQNSFTDNQMIRAQLQAKIPAFLEEVETTFDIPTGISCQQEIDCYVMLNLIRCVDKDGRVVHGYPSQALVGIDFLTSSIQRKRWLERSADA